MGICFSFMLIVLLCELVYWKAMEISGFEQAGLK